MDFKKGKTIFLVGFLALIVVWMIVFGSRIAELNRLTDEYTQAQQTISALTATTGALSTEVIRAGSDAAVEEWAYEDARMIREGDNRVAIVPIKGTPAPVTPLATSVPQPQNRFRIWWELFFDTKP